MSFHNLSAGSESPQPQLSSLNSNSSKYVSTSSSQILENQPATLISLSVRRSSQFLPTNTNAQAGPAAAEGVRSSPSKDYTRDQRLASKPPLPTPSSHQSRPSSRNLGQTNSGMAMAWASSMTPRLRVPVPDVFPPVQHTSSTGRPVSPLTRGYRGGPNGNARTLDALSPIQSTTTSATNFQYNGPHQVYAGPVNTVIAQGLSPSNVPFYPSTSSDQVRGPPQLPDSVLKDMTFHKQPSFQPHATSSELLTKAESDLFFKLLRAASQPGTQLQTPFDSRRGSVLLTSPPGATPSFPSTPTFAQMEQASVRNTACNVKGVFSNSGIPGEIQDDLLRIEMLLEFRKFKEALSQKIQNQNHILQLVNSRGQLNSQHHLQQQQPNYSSISGRSPPTLSTLQQHQLYNQSFSHWNSHPTSMDNAPQSCMGIDLVPTELEEKKPIWSDDVAEPFNSPNFLLNTFMEPHIIPTQGPVTTDQQERDFQRSLHNNGGNPDTNANDTKPISTLQTSNFDEFQALVDQSRNGLQGEGSPQRNPLLAGAQQFNESTPRYPFTPVPADQRPPSEVTRATPLQIQVTSKDPFQQSFPKPDFSQLSPNPSENQEHSGTVQQLYQKYLLDKNFQSLSPSSFKIMEQAVTRDNLTIRKPVAVSLKSSPNPVSSVNSSPERVPTQGSTLGGTDKPSPFFPGFAHMSTHIDVQMRTPGNRGRSSSRGRSASVRANSAMEEVEELGNLLSQLPVLSRKQKVEEFQMVTTSINTLKPATAMTEAESETSMIPLVSSAGTISEKARPDSKSSKVVDTEDEFRNVDTTKMSIGELVTLGKKIYRILSQLSNNSTPNQNVTAKSTHPIISAPMKLDVPSPNTPVFASGQSPPGLTTPQLVVDFNSIPNPSFITGPGLAVSKSTPRLGNRSRTATASRPPNLFRKVLQPPPTRWEGGRQRGSPFGLPNCSNAGSQVQSPDFLSPKESGTLKTPKERQSRAKFRKSMSSMVSGSGTDRSLGRTETKTLKLVPSTHNQRMLTPALGRLITHVDPLPETFVVREKYNNNRSNKNMSTYNKHRRQSTPYPFQPTSTVIETGTSTSAQMANTALSLTTARARSVLGRRNFIQENISRIQKLKKLPSSNVRPRPLPPVDKKKYDYVPSTIGGSRSRSNSATRNVEDNHRQGYPRKRSSSVPASTRGGYSPPRNLPMRSISTPRPSTGMSVHVTSSRSSMLVRPTSQGGLHISRPISRGILSRQMLDKKPVASQMTARASKVKFGALPSKTMLEIEENYGGSGSKANSLRKSRSTTKRMTTMQKQNPLLVIGNTSYSSLEAVEVKPTKKAVKSKEEKKKETKVKKKKKVTIGEAESTDDDGVKTPQGKIFNSASEQQMIREMVKAEMNLMVGHRVNHDVTENTKSSRSKSRKQSSPEEQGLVGQQLRHDYDEEVDEGGDAEGELDLEKPPLELTDNDEMESGLLTPVYTPPKYYDDALFSLENWLNPEANSVPGSAYTSAKETPATTANNNEHFYGRGRQKKERVPSKAQTVRFSLPTQQPQQQQQKTMSK